MRQYCDTHHGRWPATADTSKTDETGVYSKAWIYAIAPFMENVDTIRICPDDYRADARFEQKLTSYVLNGYLTSESIPSFVNAWKLRSSSKTIVMFELADRVPLEAAYYHVHSWTWFKKSNVLQGTVWDEIAGVVQVDRHGGGGPRLDLNNVPLPSTAGGGAHYLYADGHVAFIAGTQIATWASTTV